MDLLNEIWLLLIAIVSLGRRIIQQDWFVSAICALIILYLFQRVTHINIAEFIETLIEEAKDFAERKWTAASINFAGILTILFFGTLIIVLGKFDFIKDAVSTSIGEGKSYTLFSGVREEMLFIFLVGFCCLSVFLVHRSK